MLARAYIWQLRGIPNGPEKTVAGCSDGESWAEVIADPSSRSSSRPIADPLQTHRETQAAATTIGIDHEPSNNEVYCRYYNYIHSVSVAA